MKHISDLTLEYLQDNKPSFIYEYHKGKVANIPLSFDIETTSTYIDNEKVAFMYVWAFALADDVYYGRTWNELQGLVDLLQQAWDLNPKKICRIYVHNLAYEFQFMRKYFSWLRVFAVDERKPIKALTVQGVEFVDSLILSGFNLNKTAENLTTHKIDKLVGDLDYSLIRHSQTPITEREWGYIKNDVLIIIYYIDEQIDIYGDITKIPLTNTGRVRTYTKDKCFKKNGKRDNNTKTAYHNKMLQMTLDPESYKQLRRAFMGGFTHSSSINTNKVIENVTSIDFTSSYPAVMVSEQFPMSSPIPMEVDSIAELERLMEKYCLVFDVRFDNIESTLGYENYISESKAYVKDNAVVNNGRIYSADTLAITITEIDYKIIKQTYKWDSISIANVKIFYKRYLPKPIINSVLDLYQDKTKLKGVKGKEQEYLLSKGMLNSIYGMTVTDIARDENIYDNEEWIKEPADLDKVLNKYNNSKNRFLYYAWGVWVTAYARYNLWTGILAMGEDYIYSDTDSIKFTNYDKHKDYINTYNKTVEKKQEQIIKFYDLDPALFKPKTIQGKEKPLGVWDYEGTYSRFKTLGAKRYLVEKDDKLEITIAGLNKKQGLKYMLQKAGSNTGVFRMFTDDLFIPADHTGKNTHSYIDEPKTFKVIDYLGNELEVEMLSGIHLEPAEFTLSMSDRYLNFIENMKNGYLIEGDICY